MDRNFKYTGAYLSSKKTLFFRDPLTSNPAIFSEIKLRPRDPVFEFQLTFQF